MIYFEQKPSGVNMMIGEPDFSVTGGRRGHFISEYELARNPGYRGLMERVGLRFESLHERKPVEVWIEPEDWNNPPSMQES